MPRPKKGSKDRSFEEAIARLEKIVKDLEEGDLKLEDSLRLFEEGVSLTRQCASRLDEAQRRIDLLTRGTGGEPVLVPFESTETESSGDEEGESDEQ